jgi:hypothetical protein
LFTQADKIPSGGITTPNGLDKTNISVQNVRLPVDKPTPDGLNKTNTSMQLARLPLDKNTPYALDSARAIELPAGSHVPQVSLFSEVATPNLLDAAGTHILSVCEPWNIASPLLLDAPRTRVQLVSELYLTSTNQTLNTNGTVFLSSSNRPATF